MVRFFTIAAAVGLLFMGCGTAYAYPEYGACAGCHRQTGGTLTAVPDPLQIAIDDSGLLTFEVTDLGGSANTVIALSGADIDDPLLDATIGGGDAWTYYAASNTYQSDEINAAGTTYALGLQIGSAAVLDTYGLGVELVGSGGRLSAFDVSVQVIPEPTTLLLATLGIGCTGFLFRRRKRIA